MAIPDRYTRTAIILHWIVAVLMIGNVVLGLLGTYDLGATTRPVIDLHKSIGITVFGFALLRLLWRLGHRPPAMPGTYGKLERGAAHVAHWSLYFLIFALPLSGWLHDSAFKLAAAHPLKLFWLIPFPRLAGIAAMAPDAKEAFHSQAFALHVWLGYALYAVVFLHIAGALKHQFLDREPELQRMLP